MDLNTILHQNFNIFGSPQFFFIQELRQALPNSEIFVVGGAVRDLLLHSINPISPIRPIKTPTEFDFVIRNVPGGILEKTLAKLGDVDLVGKNFGVFKFRPHNQEQNYDIALPRTEHAFATGGYRDFDVQSDPELPIEKDLERRDFTINAIALRLSPPLSLIDPYNGVQDIEKKTIRAVGSPQERFKEDYSRMLRALRFSAQLGFEIEKETWSTLLSLISHINDEQNKQRIVPAETISKELLKSLSHDPLATMDLWDKSGAFTNLIPELLKMKGCPQPVNWHSEGDVWTHTRLCFEKIQSREFKQEFSEESPHSFNLLLTVLFHDFAKPVTLKTPETHGTDRIRFDEHDTLGAELFLKITDRLRFAAPEKLNCDPAKVAWLIKHHLLLMHGPVEQLRNTTIERYFFNPLVPGADLLKLFWLDASATVPADGHDTLINYRGIKKRIETLAGSRGPVLPPPLLDGVEIMQITKLKPGKKIGELKELLREEQLRGNIKSKNEATEFIKSHILNHP